MRVTRSAFALWTFSLFFVHLFCKRFCTWAVKIYNPPLRNRKEPKIENILRKNQNCFRRNKSTTSQILAIRRILEGVHAKNLQATILFVDFTKAFDSIHRGKMEQILLANGLLKETIAAIIMLYRNTKVKTCSPDGDTDYFDIVADVLQGDTLATYLFIICLDYVLRTSIDKIKENGFKLTKERSRRYSAQTITDADYADDIVLLANAPTQGGARGGVVIVVGKWTRRLEFKSWTRLIAFNIALIPLGKVWIQLFSLQLWVNSRID